MGKTAKQKMMDKIKAKAKNIQDIKDKTCVKGHREYVFDFITEMDEICLTATDELHFSIDIDVCADMLWKRLKVIDPDIHINVLFNEPDDWKDLRAVGVIITWSQAYQKENPDVNEEEFIDIMDLLFM